MMLMITRLRSALVLVLTAGSLAACGAAPPASVPVAPGEETFSRLTNPELTSPQLTISQANGSEANTNPLNLTEAQQKQLQQLQQEAPQNERLAQLQRMLLASELDAPALKAQLVETEDELTSAIAAMVKVRNILTPQQRQMLLKDLDQPAAAGGEPTEAQMKTLREQLRLTPDQERAFTAMNQANQAHQQASQKLMRPAYATFLSTGDTSALRQAYLEANRTRPIDAMVAFYMLLSQSQRKTLFSSSQGSGTGTGG